MTIQRPRGTRDFLPEDAWRRTAVRKAMQDVLERWGYQEISTPTFEHLELFTAKSGDSVKEEIYSFKDKGGRDIALRPELTAPVMRMYVNELQNAPKPLRLYYFGNCFRYERPQKGRFREFWQLGIELIGGNKPDSEAEVIALADQALKAVGVQGDIHVGYLGLIRAILNKIPPEHRPGIMRMIDKKERDSLARYLEDIGASHLGLQELIDLKGEDALARAVEISENLGHADSGLANLDPASEASGEETSTKGGRSSMSGREVAAELGLEDFQQTVRLLESYGVKFTIDFEIVRGLEYYSGTVFEIYAEGLGAQRQICGGGTYQLASLFGGKETSSTGFGLGFDRIMEIVGISPKRRAPVVLAFTPDVKLEAVKIAAALRKSAPVVTDVMGRGLGPQLKQASSMGAEYVVIVGGNEVASNKYTLRNMQSGEQESLSLEDIRERLLKQYSCILHDRALDEAKSKDEYDTRSDCIATHQRLGRCLGVQGKLTAAVEQFNVALELARSLGRDDNVRETISILHTDLADVLVDLGEYAQARSNYEQALEIDRRLGNDRNAAAVLVKLSTLALVRNDFSEAERRYNDALETLRRVGDMHSKGGNKKDAFKPFKRETIRRDDQCKQMPAIQQIGAGDHSKNEGLAWKQILGRLEQVANGSDNLDKQLLIEICNLANKPNASLDLRNLGCELEWTLNNFSPDKLSHLDHVSLARKILALMKNYEGKW